MTHSLKSLGDKSKSTPNHYPTFIPHLSFNSKSILMKTLKFKVLILVTISSLLMSATSLDPNSLNNPKSEKASFDPGTSITFPFEQTFYIPCANNGEGEYVTFTGIFQVVYFFFQDASGMRHVNIKQGPQKAVGVGQTTGNIYNGNGRNTFNLNVGEDLPPYYGTSTESLRLIGKGNVGSLRVQYVNHITINPNGELTSYVNINSARCD